MTSSWSDLLTESQSIGNGRSAVDHSMININHWTPTVTIRIACKNFGSSMTLKQSFSSPNNGSCGLWLIHSHFTYPLNRSYVRIISWAISVSCSGFAGPHAWITALITRQALRTWLFWGFTKRDLDCSNNAFTVSSLHSHRAGFRDVINVANKGAISVEISGFSLFIRVMKHFHKVITECSTFVSFSSIRRWVVVVRVWTYAARSETVAEESTGDSNNWSNVCRIIDKSSDEEWVTINSMGFRQLVSI